MMSIDSRIVVAFSRVVFFLIVSSRFSSCLSLHADHLFGILDIGYISMLRSADTSRYRRKNWDHCCRRTDRFFVQMPYLPPCPRPSLLCNLIGHLLATIFVRPPLDEIVWIPASTTIVNADFCVISYFWLRRSRYEAV